MQDVAYLHVVINHLPIMGVPVGLALLVLALWQRDSAVARSALLVFLGLGIATVAVYLTGKGGEDFIEHLPGRSHDAIEAHEEMATWALGSTSFLALVSLLAWLRLGGIQSLKRRPLAATAGVLGYTGKLGGRIAHVEFAAGGATDEAGENVERHGRGRHRGRD